MIAWNVVFLPFLLPLLPPLNGHGHGQGISKTCIPVLARTHTNTSHTHLFECRWLSVEINLNLPLFLQELIRKMQSKCRGVYKQAAETQLAEDISTPTPGSGETLGVDLLNQHLGLEGCWTAEPNCLDWKAKWSLYRRNNIQRHTVMEDSNVFASIRKSNVCCENGPMPLRLSKLVLYIKRIVLFFSGFTSISTIFPTHTINKPVHAFACTHVHAHTHFFTNQPYWITATMDVHPRTPATQAVHTSKPLSPLSLHY